MYDRRVVNVAHEQDLFMRRTVRPEEITPQIYLWGFLLEKMWYNPNKYANFGG